MGCTNAKSVVVVKDDTAIGKREREELENFTSRTNIRSVYNFSGVIGKGGFGTVKLAVAKNGINDKKVAIKIIEKSRLKNKQYTMLRELQIMRSLDHPNIIKFYEVYQDEMFFYICMEYCSGGELLERITRQKRFNEDEAARIMKKIFSVINHMHSKGIVHRDLKLENILFLNKSSDSEIKLIDFGLSKKCEDDSTQLYTMVGTPLYVSPEVLKGRYDKTCDDWTTGVIMYILLVGYPPFFGKTRADIFKRIEKAEFSLSGKEWEVISEEAKDLLRKILVVDTKKRLTVDKALNHPWIVKHTVNKMPTPRENSVVTESKNSGQLKQVPSQQLGQIDPKILNMLKNFKPTSKFRNEAMKVIVNQLNEQEIDSLKEAFTLIDKDQTGMIKVSELQEVMEKVGFKSTKEEIEKIILNISPFQDKQEISIRYSEFLAATLDQIIYLKAERLWSIFKYFDPSNTNYISLDDLREIFLRNGRNIPDNEIRQMVNEISKNKQDRISFEEFKKIMIGEAIDYKN